MANLAKFTINATASTPGGFDMTISQALTFALEASSPLVNRWTLEVYDSADATSPLASKNAPALTLVGATSGKKVDAATPGSTITTTAPSSGVHSYIVRSKVNGGKNAAGKDDPDLVYERIICIKTGSGLRKVIASEATQYAAGGWADAQNDLIDAGAGPLTAPGGAGDANKLAAASAAGTNLQYAAGIFLTGSGTGLGFDAATAQPSIVQNATTAATDTTRRKLLLAGQLATGNTDTSGGTVEVRGGDASGAGGTHRGGLTRLFGGAATGGSGTRTGGDIWVGGGFGGTRNGNIVFATSSGSYDPDTFNWQGMGGGMWVNNAGQLPTGDPATGFFHYANAGFPFWRWAGMIFGVKATATTATAGAQTLPANPVGFLTVSLNGTDRKIPYYAT